MVSGMTGSGFENGRCYSRPPWRPRQLGPGLTTAWGPLPASRSTGATSPRCAKARGGSHPPPGRPLEEALLEEVGLVGVLHGVGLLPHAVGEGHQAHGPTVETTAQRVEDGTVHLVETELVHAEELEAFGGERRRDGALGAHLDEVPHPAQEPVGDARGAPGPRRRCWRAPSCSTSTPRIPAERTTILCRSSASYRSRRPTKPKRSRNGLVSSPVRVVAPTRVKRGRSRRIERAVGPLPIRMSSWKSSMAG